MAVHEKLLIRMIREKVLNQIDDFGVVIIRKRCSIQHGEKTDNC